MDNGRLRMLLLLLHAIRRFIPTSSNFIGEGLFRNCMREHPKPQTQSYFLKVSYHSMYLHLCEEVDYNIVELTPI